MKTTKHYHIPIVPSYFSNISSIDQLAILQDAPTEGENMELVMYFNDLYHVFLHRFAQFGYRDTLSAEEEKQMVAMLSELVSLKHKMRD